MGSVGVHMPAHALHGASRVSTASRMEACANPYGGNPSTQRLTTCRLVLHTVATAVMPWLSTASLIASLKPFIVLSSMRFCGTLGDDATPPTHPRSRAHRLTPVEEQVRMLAVLVAVVAAVFVQRVAEEITDVHVEVWGYPVDECFSLTAVVLQR